MLDSIVPKEETLKRTVLQRHSVRWGRRLFFRQLAKLRHGRIMVIDGLRQWSFGSRQADFHFEARITVNDDRFYSKAVFGGSVGAAEAYMAGLWSTDDLTDLIRIIIRNQDLFIGLDRGWARLSKPVYSLFHFLRKNTPRGSRQNIIAHYDLSNDFYKLFLDDTLTYSCAIFEGKTVSLREAQIAKYDRACRKLQLTPADRVIEIGSGWGGFSIYAARNFGCHVTATTISAEQYRLAKRRIANAGLADRIQLIDRDYRNISGTFDKLVSIEMIEAIGHHYLDTFFRRCSHLLKPDGMMLLQAITISDHAYEQHKHSVDFIKRYIFPGSCIPSVTAFSNSIANKTDLRLFHLEDITPHYARTLRAWREQFFNNIEKVRALGFNDAFIRMWEFYLCYCEAGFAERYLGDVQILFTKPLCQRESILPRIP
ncbi:class I SAM-dependent methyltransferase [Thermodesulfobacteriota bacterium]